MELARALEFVTAHRNGVLLVVRKDGRPHASNIIYGTWDDTVHISVTADRAKTRNLERDPRAALHVTSDDFWEWVVVEGTASLSPVTTDPGDDTAARLRELYESISGPHPDWDEYDQAMIDQRRLVVSIPLDHAYGQLPG